MSIVVRKHENPVHAHVDATQIEQALANLVMNAIHASPGGETVTITTRHETVARTEEPNVEVECAVLDVEDHGHGIAKEHLDRIFEPFFTTKSVGEGTGLGLSVTHGIIEGHEGWMTAKSELGKGTTFTVYLPVTSSGAPPESIPPSNA